MPKLHKILIVATVFILSYANGQRSGGWRRRGSGCPLGGCCKPRRFRRGSIIGPDSPTNGAALTFTCDRGYRIAGETGRVKVLVCINEKWNKEIPECERYACNARPPPNNGKIAGGAGPGSIFPVGSYITYTCNSGYVPKGAMSIRCAGKDDWDNKNPPRCERTGGGTSTRTGDCSTPSDPTNGRVSFRGQVASFYCNSGYELVGRSRIYCDDGRWDNDYPYCRKDDDGHDSHDPDDRWRPTRPRGRRERCEAPENPRNGFVSSQIQGSTGRATFRCRRGYELDGATRVRCRDGEWDSDFPECERRRGRPRSRPSWRRRQCERPDHPENGWVTAQITGRRGHADFHCNSGYTLRGEEHVDCRDGEWEDFPTCDDDGDSGWRRRGGRRGGRRRGRRDRCPNLDSPRNGWVHAQSQRVGSQAEFGCDSGYTLDGPSRLECDDNGEWSGGRIPSCTRDGRRNRGGNRGSPPWWSIWGGRGGW